MSQPIPSVLGGRYSGLEGGYQSNDNNGLRLPSPTAYGNLAAWFDAKESSTVTISTGVSQWDDRSGNGRHLKQATGAAQPSYNTGTYPYLLFNGTSQFLKCDAFTLNQPETVYLVSRQATWTSGDRLFDGNSNDSMMLYQSASSPNVRLFAGGDSTLNGNWAIGSDAVITAVFNNTAVLKVNNGTDSGGSCGTSNAGGFTLGARASGLTNFANIRVYEVLIYSVAHSADVQTRIVKYLGQKWGIAI